MKSLILCCYKDTSNAMICNVENQEILSHRKNISGNQLVSKFFSKTVTFTKFVQKKCNDVHSVEKFRESNVFTKENTKELI